MSSSEDHVDDGEDVDLINNAMEGNLNEVRALSRAGANVNAQRDSDGATALIVASGNGHVDVVESLLQGVRIDVNLQRTNDLNLIKNALKGNYKKVRDLLHHGANVNAHNDGGETALMSASKRNHEKVVDLLLEQSHVDVNAQDSNGATALVVASSRGYVEVVRSLLRHNKVDANLPMNDGRTALTVVSDKGSTALHAAKQKALLRMFQDHGETLKAVEKDRALLPNVMTTKNAVPIELTYQYIKRYDTNRKLRSGDFRDVFLAEDSDLPEPKRFVVKMIKLSHRCDESLASFQKELLALKTCHHPNIIALYGYNLNVDHKKHFLVYEYAVNGSLDRFLKSDKKRADLTAARRLSIMYGVAKAVHFLHTGIPGFEVFHRDIKSANICLAEDLTPRLIDCGLAKFVEKKHNAFPLETILRSGSSAGPPIGTHGYTCPDYTSKKALQMKCAYIPAYDVYSFGVVMAELILGHLNDGKPTTVFQTYILNGEKPIVDGWKQLNKDAENHADWNADNQAGWNADTLELVCKTSIGCLILTSYGRLSTDKLLDLLKYAIDVHDGKTGDVPEDAIATLDEIMVNIRKRSSESEGAGLGFCKHCDLTAGGNRRPAVVKCSEGHALCADCLGKAVWIAPPSAAVDFKLPCLVFGCSSQAFTFDDLSVHVLPVVWSFQWQKKNDQGFNDVKELQKNTVQGLNRVMELQKDTKKVVDKTYDLVKQFASEVDSRLSELASNTAIAKQLKLCPALVVITPSDADGPVNVKKWFTKSTKQKYKVTFYCERLGIPGHDPCEISVDKKWIVHVAPWLRIAINIGSTLNPTKIAPAVIKEFPLPVHTKEMKALIDELRIKEKHGEQQTLGGVALEAIGKEAKKKENFEKWGNEMEYVQGENGRMMWVKKSLGVEDACYEA